MFVDRFRAMGTQVETLGEESSGLLRVRDLFRTTEAACSRFRPDSDLERLNDAPGTRLSLPRSLVGPVAAAAEMRRRTGGLVDIGLGGVLAAWGYDRSFDDLEAPEAAPDAIESAGWWTEGDVLHRRPGTRLDLGGIAKGWTADRAVEMGFASVVSAGGDIRSRHPETRVTVIDPGERPVVRITIGRGALATSSRSRRRWQVADREAHHLIDPRTLRPAETPVVTAAAVAATAVEAEAAAKAVMLLGERGLAWADEQPWIRGAVVLWSDGGAYATTGMDVEAA